MRSTAPACACWQPLKIASTSLPRKLAEFAFCIGQGRGALVQRSQHQADAGQDEAAAKLALRRQEVDRRRRSAHDDQRGLLPQELPRPDQRRPAIAAELRGIAIAVDDAALLGLGDDPMRGGCVGPHLEQAADEAAQARSGDVRDHDLRGHVELRERGGEAGHFVEQRMARFDPAVGREALAIALEEAPLQERVSDIHQDVLFGDMMIALQGSSG